MSTLTPEEAGRRAEALSKDWESSTAGQNKNAARQPSIDTALAHSGVSSWLDDNAPMSPPIHLASTYVRPAPGPYGENDSAYSRMDNPTRLLLEREIARLECFDGKEGDADSAICCAFSSGMMAATSIVLAHSSPLRVLLPRDLYHGVPTVLADVFDRFGVTTTRVDMQDASAVRHAVADCPDGGDVIVWIETPSNPLCQVIDIQALCDELRKSETKVTTVVDSTLAPPTITQPLLLGADIVMHSGTKGLSGHSDALLGVTCSSPWTERGIELGPRLKQVQIAAGGVASAFDSWLTIRGLRTLSLRAKRQSETALRVATFLLDHPLVRAVHYPGLPSHPSYDVAKRQMNDGMFGGVLSLELEDASRAMALAGALRTIQRATSLGGTETLIEHRYSIEPEGRRTSPPGLLRLSCGLEDPADLEADLDRALRISDAVCSGDS